MLQGIHRRVSSALAACEDIARQDKRYAPLCLRHKANALRDLGRHEELERLLSAVLAERPLPDPRLVRRIIRQRQLRARFFDGVDVRDEERVASAVRAVVERFHRIDGQSESGSGLGVSIAQRVAALHGLRLQHGPGPDGQGVVATLTRGAGGA